MRASRVQLSDTAERQGPARIDGDLSGGGGRNLLIDRRPVGQGDFDRRVGRKRLDVFHVQRKGAGHFGIKQHLAARQRLDGAGQPVAGFKENFIRERRGCDTDVTVTANIHILFIRLSFSLMIRNKHG
jgi:hypothetical protein